MTDTESKIARALVAEQLVNHPLPWIVRRDWGWEVIASDRHRIASVQSDELAKSIVELANEVNKDTYAEVT